MKRRLAGLAVILVLLVAVGLVVASFFLGSFVKRGIEKAGPSMTKVDVKVGGASVALFSGSGELKGLVVGNPPGYSAPSAISVGSAAIELVPKSVFGGKVIVHSIKIKAPEVTLEGSLQGNNLSKILDNIKRSETEGNSSSSSKSNSGESRRIQVDDILITEGKINLQLDLLGKRSASVSLPEIHLTNLGQGPEGITAAELSEKLLRVVLEKATIAATTQITALGKNLGDAAQNLGNAAQSLGSGAQEKLKSLFKK